jgi:hypothetical protein
MEETNMKRSIILSLIGLVFGILPAVGASYTSSTEHLVLGKMWMEGGCRTNLIQRLHVEVTNNGTEDYRSYWCAFDPQNGVLEGPDGKGILAYSSYEQIIIPAGEMKEVTMEFEFSKPGHYQINVWTENQRIDLFTYFVDIAEYQAPDVTGIIQLDMLERTDEGNILYRDYAHFKITGTATITNKDENTVIGWDNMRDGGGSGLQCVVWPWFGDNNWGYPWFYNLGYEIKAGETITKNFTYEFTAVPEEDKEYSIQIDVLGNTVARIPFKVRQCTNTYWTADGHVKPLPIEDNQVLQVPAEAVAVDMRGQYAINTLFSIDASQANPNCLYFLGFLDNVPQGLSLTTNVIRDYEAKTLVVDANCDYFCPMPFKSKTAFFNYTPVSESQGPASPVMSQIMSGALVIPFEATQAWLSDINGLPGNDAGFSGPDIRMFSFTGDNGDVMSFAPVSEHRLNAYEPYLMFVKPSRVSFYAEDAAIPPTREAVVRGTNFNFIGQTTATATPNSVYRWNADNYYFFQSVTDDLVKPFSAQMYEKTEEKISGYNRLKIDIGNGKIGNEEVGDTDEDDPETTSVIDHSSTRNHETVAVYSISGQRVDRIQSGLYIINGQKIVVK